MARFLEPVKVNGYTHSVLRGFLGPSGSINHVLLRIFQNLTLVIAAVCVKLEENEMATTIAMHVSNVPTQNVIANFTLCAQNLQTAIITEKL